MKKIYVLIVSLFVMSVGWYLHSQDDKNQNDTTQQKVDTEPVATSQATKRLLMSLDTQIVTLQKKISEHSERLGGVFTKWKKEGKIKQAEQWNQVRAAINALLSEVKIILQDFDRIEKLRRNKELFTLLATLDRESQKITPKNGDMRYIMQSSSLYGKSIFNDKILEKIKTVTQVKEAEKKKTDAEQELFAPSYDDYEFPDFEEFLFEEFDSGLDDDEGGFDFGEDFSDDFDFYF